MRRMMIVLAALVLAMACDSLTGVLGPLGFGIESGRDQVVQAGGDMEPAVARVWTDPNGVAHLGIGPAPLYAQTSVQGVEGAVVCVGEVAIEGEPIVPHSRCTATESDGRATFHLTPSTRAGRHRTPIVAEYDGEALTPDTVTANVEPGPPVATASGQVHGSQGFDPREAGDSLRFSYMADEYDNFTDRYRVEASSGDWLAATDTTARLPTLIVLRQPSIGDTVGIVYRTYSGALLVDGVGQVVESNITDMAQDTVINTWKIRVWHRDSYPPES